MKSVAIFGIRLALLLGVIGWGSLARASLESAQQANALLRADTWSRVLRIENSRSHSHYPRIVYATVFEFEDILWFYTDADGTQSLSLKRDRLEEDKSDLGPLLLAIEPGFTRFEVLSGENAEPKLQSFAMLVNGCFIQALHASNELRHQGMPLLSAELVTFYRRVAGLAGSVIGHTFLAFQTTDGWYFFDPTTQQHPEKLGERIRANDALVIAQRAGYGKDGVQFVKGVLLDVKVDRPPLEMAKAEPSLQAMNEDFWVKSL
ncbi:MAG TPA: hypothetical protein VKC60_00155 [Opitutaceae bacterium]|nr:hypothetical protein [Opitutaceae bacterium]